MAKASKGSVFRDAAAVHDFTRRLQLAYRECMAVSFEGGFANENSWEAALFSRLLFKMLQYKHEASMRATGNYERMDAELAKAEAIVWASLRGWLDDELVSAIETYRDFKGERVQ